MDLNLLIEQIDSLAMLEKNHNQAEIYLSIRNELVNYRNVILELKIMVFNLKNLIEKLEGGKNEISNK